MPLHLFKNSPGTATHSVRPFAGSQKLARADHGHTRELSASSLQAPSRRHQLVWSAWGRSGGRPIRGPEVHDWAGAGRRPPRRGDLTWARHILSVAQRAAPGAIEWYNRRHLPKPNSRRAPQRAPAWRTSPTHNKSMLEPIAAWGRRSACTRETFLHHGNTQRE